MNEEASNPLSGRFQSRALPIASSNRTSLSSDLSIETCDGSWGDVMGHTSAWGAIWRSGLSGLGVGVALWQCDVKVV